MKLVVKVGGTLLDDSAKRLRIGAEIKRQLEGGHQILLVHGGGKQLSRYLERSGIPSHFVQGLRVTTAEALDGVVKVFAGTVNHELLAAFHQLGVPAVGISGIDAGCLVAQKLVSENGQDWGFVGKITAVDPRLWTVLISEGMLPVMACLAVGDQGEIYNINADQAAVACAIHLRADALIFLTDVDGVRDRDGRTLGSIGSEEIPGLLNSGAVTAGMLAKMNAVQDALAGGVSCVHIGNGQLNGSLENGILQCIARTDRVTEGIHGGTTIFSSSPEPEASEPRLA